MSTTTYDYRNKNGGLLYQVVRPDGKRFYQRRPLQDGWAMGMKAGWYERDGESWTHRGGVRGERPAPESTGELEWLDDVARVPYALPELIDRDRLTERVFVVEGEKDADRLRELGLLGTTSVMGAGKASRTDWSSLAGRDVVVVPDNDDPGRKHVVDLVGLLKSVAASVRVLELPELPEKGDVSDWLDGGGTTGDLMDYASEAPRGSEWLSKTRWGIREVSASELRRSSANRAPLEYLPCFADQELVVCGFSHLFAAFPKAGKTTTIYQWCTEWAKAGISVLYVTEESEVVWAARLKRTSSPAPDEIRLVFGLGVEEDKLLERAEWGEEQVVILDTIRGTLKLSDENDNAEVMKKLRPWLATLRGKTLILAHHLRKSGGDHGLAVAGAGALVGAVDRVLELRHDTGLPKRRRVLSTMGRIETGRDLMIELQDDGILKALGNPEAVAQETLRARILAVLPLRDRAMRKQEVQSALADNGTPPGIRTLDEALKALHVDGQVLRLGAGKKGDPHRWALVNQEPETDPDFDSRTTEVGRAGNELATAAHANGRPTEFDSRTPLSPGARIESPSDVGEDGGIEI